LIVVMKRLIIFCAMLAWASPLMAQTPNLPAGWLSPGMVVQTRNGPVD
jgi:hypothetical protein